MTITHKYRSIFFAFAFVCCWYYNNVYHYHIIYAPSTLIAKSQKYIHHEHELLQTNQDNQTERGGNENENDLTTIQHRYYIYNTSGLLIPPAKNVVVGSHEIWAIYETLQRHPLRTLNPDEATFFIPPIFVNTINANYKAKNRGRRDFMSALDLVTSSNIYQTTMGSRHIFISIDGTHFSYKGVGVDYNRPLCLTLQVLCKIISQTSLKTNGFQLMPLAPSKDGKNAAVVQVETF